MLTSIISQIRGLLKCSLFLKENSKVQKMTLLQLLSSLKFNEQDQTVFNIIHNFAVKSEIVSSYGYVAFMKKLVESKEQILATEASLASKEDLEKYISTLKYSELVSSALKLAGYSGKIVIEKTHSQTDSIELSSGYTFIAKNCFSISKPISYEHVNVICIDGYIESVSEITQLLESCVKKDLTLLVVRGLHDDVRQTLKVNFDRNLLKIIPIIPSTELDGINTIKDIAVVSGCDVISTTKGNLLNCVTIENAGIVDRITVTANTVTIFNSKTATDVSIHVGNLNSRKKLSVDDVADLLNQRIVTLTGKHVIIRLKDDIDFILKSQEIDYAIRAIKIMAKYGIKNNMPALTELVSTYYANKCKNLLNEIVIS